MTVSVDAVGTQNGVGTATVTQYDYTGITVASNSERALLIAMSVNKFGGPHPTGVSATWDQGGTNQAMTQVAVHTAPGFDSGEQVFIFALLNPTTGNKTLRVSWTNNASIAMNAISLFGVEQASNAAAFTGTATNSGSTTPSSQTVASATGDYVLSCHGNTQATVSTSHTGWLDNQGVIFGTSIGIDGYNVAAVRSVGAASVVQTIAITPNGDWFTCGINVKASSGGDTLFIGNNLRFM